MNKPYVYKLTHKITNQFYIGYREANKVSADLDLGREYFSSGQITKANFNDYTSEILMEFENGDMAYDYEQALIKENRSNPLLLNKRYDSGSGLRFIFRGPHTQETIAKIIAAGTGRRYKLSEEAKANIAKAAKNRAPPSEETKMKISLGRIGKKHKEETKRKIKNALIESHARGDFPPHSEAAKKKMSDSQKKLWTDQKRKSQSELVSLLMTPERKQKISDSHKGKKLSEETRHKMSESAKARHRLKNTQN